MTLALAVAGLVLVLQDARSSGPWWARRPRRSPLTLASASASVVTVVAVDEQQRRAASTVSPAAPSTWSTRGRRRRRPSPAGRQRDDRVHADCHSLWTSCGSRRGCAWSARPRAALDSAGAGLQGTDTAIGGSNRVGRRGCGRRLRPPVTPVPRRSRSSAGPRSGATTRARHATAARRRPSAAASLGSRSRRRLRPGAPPASLGDSARRSSAAAATARPAARGGRRPAPAAAGSAVDGACGLRARSPRGPWRRPAGSGSTASAPRPASPPLVPRRRSVTRRRPRRRPRRRRGGLGVAGAPPPPVRRRRRSRRPSVGPRAADRSGRRRPRHGRPGRGRRLPRRLREPRLRRRRRSRCAAAARRAAATAPCRGRGCRRRLPSSLSCRPAVVVDDQPRPLQCSHVSLNTSSRPVPTRLRVICTRPSEVTSATWCLVRSRPRHSSSRRSTRSRLVSSTMSMKSMTMMPPMSRSRSWRTISSAASRLFLVTVSSRLPPGAGELAGVDVDDGHRLGAVDDQRAARGQPHLAVQRLGDLLVDAVRRRRRRSSPVQRSSRSARSGATCATYALDRVPGLVAGDDQRGEVLVEDVADDPTVRSGSP